jgi:HEAT repeat protein
MHDVDDLDTDNVQGVARAYRAGGRAVVDRMAAAMRSDPRPRVRANAVTVLLDVFYFHDEKDKARPYLLEALGDPSPDVVSRAADGLAGVFPDDAAVKTALSAQIDALRAATLSPDPIVQAHAMSALQKMGERPPLESMLRASSSGLRRQGIEQAAAASERSVAPLLIELARTDPEVLVRSEAVPVAAQLATPEQRDSFLDALVTDPEDLVAVAAIKAAGATKAVSLAKKIEAILAMPEGNRTEAAVTALGALGDAAAVPMIAAHLNDRSTDTKWSAKLVLDVLAAPARGVPEWQEWARANGYLPAK